MVKKEFKAESRRLLDLMVNSIYTHKEIFLRELISNASDAIDKLHFESLTNTALGVSREDFCIRITANEQERTLTIADNGRGMTAKELEDNLGTIAKSGTKEFREANPNAEDIDVIGQFGVGFYSAFMVAERVRVVSRAYNADTAWAWESTGEDGYTLTEAAKESPGTEITLTIKPDEGEEDYSHFLKDYTLQNLVKKYSDYIRYPIKMMTKQSRAKEGSTEYETYYEDAVLNSMVPIWRKPKNEVTDEQYAEYYKEKYYDHESPVATIRTSVEGGVSYTALLFIPKKAPYDYFTKQFKRGLELYSSSVMIMDKCEELLPEYFGFVRGVVDSADLSLNISREMLQHDRQLKAIATNLKKKIKTELLKLLENEREKYDEFFEAFGIALKYGVYESYGMNKDFLQDLLLFYGANEKKRITLKEYVAAMPEGQKHIYYACGENIERTLKLPQTELVRDRGFDILCLTDDIDEFALKMMQSYGEHSFMSVADNDLDIATDDEKKAVEAKEAESKDVLSKIKEVLGERVHEVRLTPRLKTSPCCLTTDGALSIEMEKVLSQMPLGGGAKAERVLELNPNHPIFAALFDAVAEQERFTDLAMLLYEQALLIEGLPPEDPVAHTERVFRIHNSR